MPKGWFERAESAWGGGCAEIWSVFREAARLIRSAPLSFLGLTLVYLAVRSYLFGWLVQPQLTGWPLYVVTWGAGLFAEILAFVTLLVAARIAATRFGRSRKPDMKEAVWRVVRLLQYPVVWLLVVEQFSGMLGWWLFEGGRAFFDSSPLLFSGTLYMAYLPALFLLARFGFAPLGSFLDGRFTASESCALSRRGGWPLFLTVLLWWLAWHVPSDVLTSVNWGELQWILGVWFIWLSKPFRAVTTIFAVVVAVVWYERLRFLKEE